MLGTHHMEHNLKSTSVDKALKITQEYLLRNIMWISFADTSAMELLITFRGVGHIFWTVDIFYKNHLFLQHLQMIR